MVISLTEAMMKICRTDIMKYNDYPIGKQLETKVFRNHHTAVS